MNLNPFRRRKPAARKSVRSFFNGASTVARLSDFTPSYASANVEIEADMARLRGRARNLANNDPLVNRWMQLLELNVVGHVGFNLQTRARNPNGGMDKYGNDTIEKRWRKWSETATTDGQMTMRAAFQMAVRTHARDGEVLIEEVVNNKYHDSYGLRFIEADQLDETLNEDNHQGKGNVIRMGVELDQQEKPVAYHLLTSHPGDNTWFKGGRKYRRVPADRLIHLFKKERPGQVRGVPPTAPVMGSVKLLGGYRDAEITNRRIAASKMGFFTKEDEKVDGLGTIADTVDDDTGKLEMDVEPGKFTELPQGMKFDQFNPSSSGTDYADFEKQIIRSIAAGLGVSYNSIAADLENVSYSSIRQGELQDRDAYRMIQKFFIERMANRVFANWSRYVMLQADFPFPFSRYNKFLDASTFRPRGWAWVDPSKEVSAAVKAIDANLTSMTHVVGEQGRDIEDVFEEIESERELMKTLNIEAVATE